MVLRFMFAIKFSALAETTLTNGTISLDTRRDVSGRKLKNEEDLILKLVTP